MAGIAGVSGRITLAEQPGHTVDVVIDYRQPKTWEGTADEVKRLADEGMTCKQIAEQLGLGRSTASLLWRRWHESRGLPVPAGTRDVEPDSGPTGFMSRCRTLLRHLTTTVDLRD